MTEHDRWSRSGSRLSFYDWCAREDSKAGLPKPDSLPAGQLCRCDGPDSTGAHRFGCVQHWATGLKVSMAMGTPQQTVTRIGEETFVRVAQLVEHPPQGQARSAVSAPRGEGRGFDSHQGQPLSPSPASPAEPSRFTLPQGIASEAGGQEGPLPGWPEWPVYVLDSTGTYVPQAHSYAEYDHGELPPAGLWYSLGYSKPGEA